MLQLAFSLQWEYIVIAVTKDRDEMSRLDPTEEVKSNKALTGCQDIKVGTIKRGIFRDENGSMSVGEHWAGTVIQLLLLGSLVVWRKPFQCLWLELLWEGSPDASQVFFPVMCGFGR